MRLICPAGGPPDRICKHNVLSDELIRPLAIKLFSGRSHCEWMAERQKERSGVYVRNLSD